MILKSRVKAGWSWQGFHGHRDGNPVMEVHDLFTNSMITSIVLNFCVSQDLQSELLHFTRSSKTGNCKNEQITNTQNEEQNHGS